MLLSEFRPVACRSSSFQLLHVAVSGPCRLSEFTLTGPHYSIHLVFLEWESKFTSPVAFIWFPHHVFFFPVINKF